jgi:RNA polymerase sigma-70 factor (ECF subfamily)
VSGAPNPPAETPGRPSFRALFDAELTYVWNALRRLGVHEADVEDIVHDVFLVVHRHLAAYDPSRPLRPWLFGICVRTASDYRRLARHRREAPPLEDEPPDSAPGAEEMLARRQAQRLVTQALDVLDLDRRAVLILHDLEEQPMPVVAAALEIPLNTAYSRLRLARQDFAQAVSRLQKRRGQP